MMRPLNSQRKWRKSLHQDNLRLNSAEQIAQLSLIEISNTDLLFDDFTEHKSFALSREITTPGILSDGRQSRFRKRTFSPNKSSELRKAAKQRFTHRAKNIDVNTGEVCIISRKAGVNLMNQIIFSPQKNQKLHIKAFKPKPMLKSRTYFRQDGKNTIRFKKFEFSKSKPSFSLTKSTRSNY